MGEARTLTARWVFPVAGPPVAGGRVVVRGGRVVVVETASGPAADEDLGNAALLPGLVNAHTHLDLSGLRGQVAPGPDFIAWLRAVIAHRRSRTAGQVLADVRAGLAECLARGTTLVGDVSAGGLSFAVLSAAPVRAVVFYELLGLPQDRALQAWRDFRAWYAGHPATPTCRPGLSPHAPYSVRASLFRAAAAFARRHRAPLATHLAETGDELELLAHHRGPFVGFLQELGVWDAGGLVADPGRVLRISGRLAHVLFAHGNYLPADAPLPAGGWVVYCPRTHAAFGHPPHPAAAGRPGVRYALGTDSLASNPDLDVLAETRFLYRRHPHLGGPAVLHMATLGGAEALGWGAETGSLAPGKSADLAVVPLPDRDDPDPYRLLLDSDLPACRVMFRGRWVQG